MTRDEALRVAVAYEEYLKGSTGFKLQHLVSMVPTMMTMEDEGKLMRWLGFMQGVLYASKEFTLEQLKWHNQLGTGQLFRIKEGS